MKTVLQVVLFLVAIGLAYLIYASIQRPIDFKKEQTARYNATIERLKDIRKAELAFKDVHGRFTGSWDTLLHFVKFDSIRMVRKIGNITDSMLEQGITERKALQLGLIVRDTIRESVLTSVFGDDYEIDQLKYIPVPDTVAEFQLGATVIATGSGINVPVFEAKAHNNILLRGLDEQLRINLNDQRRVQNKYPGLKVGSLTETNNNAGNWE
ncbi:MAG: hypothetical protein KA780_00545 [Prolixibacteraceae bacterium]|jgi:hypothetical protein|nr:hypothetical protein [Prolixibacteraceae bacterium]NLX28813.1 hypothetical protein [Bacteroidales bacterium]HOY51594.1 hypothetical protein [Prolixibacteraceae bacterium]HPJ77418.1 hypothetical protein [Prolixibacteraceae bacterium]HRV88251.1 hypothetical protein [Prolixibacteraceae bacterium]